MYRTEWVVGERKDLLIRVAWDTRENPDLITFIRFPRTLNPDRLCQALMNDASLDVLPGKGAGRRKLHFQTKDPRKTVYIGRRPEFTLTDNGLLWQRTFPFRTPKATQIQSWIDALVAAVTHTTPVFDDRCESCTTGSACQYVLVD